MNAAGWLRSRREYFLLLPCLKLPWQRVPFPDVVLDEQGPSIPVRWPKIALSLLFPPRQAFLIPTLSNASAQLTPEFLFVAVSRGGPCGTAALVAPRSRPHIRAPGAVPGPLCAPRDVPAGCPGSSGTSSCSPAGPNAARAGSLNPKPTCPGAPLAFLVLLGPAAPLPAPPLCCHPSCFAV